MISKKPTKDEEEKKGKNNEGGMPNVGFQPLSSMSSQTNSLAFMSDVIRINSSLQQTSAQEGEGQINTKSNPRSQKKTRKRRRLSAERDMSPETFRKARNKRLAKESRMRKSAYIKSLEEKISTLEKQIVSLNEKCESYRK